MQFQHLFIKCITKVHRCPKLDLCQVSWISMRQNDILIGTKWTLAQSLSCRKKSNVAAPSLKCWIDSTFVCVHDSYYWLFPRLRSKQSEWLYGLLCLMPVLWIHNSPSGVDSPLEWGLSCIFIKYCGPEDGQLDSHRMRPKRWQTAHLPFGQFLLPSQVVS